MIHSAGTTLGMASTLLNMDTGNLLRTEEEMEVLEPSITKLQAFVWKVKEPENICNLIWPLITGHVAVTRNLNCHNMRCDNYCPRYG